MLNVKRDVECLNNFYSIENLNIVEMAKVLYKQCNDYIQGNVSLKAQYFSLLIKNGCKYSFKTLKERYYTISNFPQLLTVSKLKMPFSNYILINDYIKKLGLIRKELLRGQAELKQWSYRRLTKEIKTVLNAKKENQLCVCDRCGNRHKKNGK